jgi:hypothetical protein
MRHLTIELYIRLLRLYPPQFRADFAEEMQEIFEQAASEASDTVALLSLLTLELRDLPLRLLQEHLHERRKPVLVPNSGVITMQPRLPLRLFQGFSLSLLLVCIIFFLMVALPFYSLGLYTQSEWDVITGALGPEAFAPYGGTPNFLPGLAVLVMLAAPVWGVLFGFGVLLMLGALWRYLSVRQRKFGFLALLAAIMPTLYLLLPTGRIVFSWWMN